MGNMMSNENVLNALAALFMINKYYISKLSQRIDMETFVYESDLFEMDWGLI